MTSRLPGLVFPFLALFAACAQVPPQAQHMDSAEARYVDVTALTNSDEYAHVQVLTSVPLRHITAVDAEARLLGTLPEGVRMSRVGKAKNLLLQGPGQGVVQAIKALEKLDVR